jgi:hypothetical protein
LQLGGSWDYKGALKIDLNVNRATREIVLNSKEIDVQNAEILGKDGMSRNISMALDAQNMRLMNLVL